MNHFGYFGDFLAPEELQHFGKCSAIYCVLNCVSGVRWSLEI